MDIVVACENVLGWVPDESKPLWKARANAAGAVKRAMAKHNVTLDQLELAIEYCRRKKEAIASPAALVFRVEQALELANEPEPELDVSTDVEAAVQWERDHEDHFSLGWITRLTRAVGNYRAEVLQEWRSAGRG